MSNPPVQIGNIYESRDRREKGRQVRVVEEAVGHPSKWVCQHLKMQQVCRLSEKGLRERWTLISTNTTDTLQALLRCLERIDPRLIEPYALRELREAWVEAGCPGLKKD